MRHEAFGLGGDQGSEEPLDRDSALSALEAMRHGFEHLAGATPTPHFSLRTEADEKSEHDSFLSCANFLYIPRQVELLRFSCLSELASLSRTLIDCLHSSQNDFVYFCFSTRRLLELTAFLHKATIDVAGLESKLDGVKNLNPSAITNADFEGDLEVFETLSRALFRIRVPTTLDWSRVADESQLAGSVERHAERPSNILKSVQLLNERIPSAHPVYSICSEVLHPNSMVYMSKWIMRSMEETYQVAPKRGWHGIFGGFQEGTGNSDELNAVWFEVILSLLIPRVKRFQQDVMILIREDVQALISIERRLMRICRPISRACFKKYVDPSHSNFEGLCCPCGSEKDFRKCCAGS